MQPLFVELSVLCVATATGMTAFWVLCDMRPPAAAGRSSGPGLFALFRPAFPLVSGLARRLLERAPRGRDWMAARLDAAGYGHCVRPDDYLSLSLLLMLALAVIGLPFRLPVQAGLMVLGLVFPVIWSAGAIQERHAAIRRSMPYVVDLLALCTLAGLEFGSAIDRVLEKIEPGPLGDELKLARRDMALGRSLSGALQAMAKRIRLSEMTSFVAILCQGLDLGAGVAPVLSAQAEKMRLERMEKAERSGAEAQQKILLPLLLLMVPAFACLVFIPLLVSQARSYLAGFGGL